MSNSYYGRKIRVLMTMHNAELLGGDIIYLRGVWRSGYKLDINSGLYVYGGINMVQINIANEFFKAASFIGVLMTDENGIIIYVDDGFELDYGLESKELIGKSVYELEDKKVFNPSVAAMVLKNNKEITAIQELKNGEKVIVSAFPIYENDKISQVITFTRDINRYIKIKNLYEELSDKIAQYDMFVKKLSYDSEVLGDYITNNEAFHQTLKSLHSVASYNINILILGETGVGKTLLAKKVHEISEQKSGKFIDVNCGAIPEALVESELFGYEKGSFTGADQNGRKGLFEIADNGTLFLDEISELPLQSQSKLLKVLQDGEFRRIGGSKNIKTNCRIISATNKNLLEEVEKGKFRRDLYYRLNTFIFTVPPLRERKEDIGLLASKLLKKANVKFNLHKTLDPSIIKIFLRYDWPGNIRELENIISRMVITSKENIITTSSIPADLYGVLNIESNNSFMPVQNITELSKAMEAYEGEIIRNAYLQYKTSYRVAKALNISQATAARKIRKYVKKKESDFSYMTTK